MKFRTTALAALVSVLLVSCVSSKKYKAAQASLSDLNNKYAQLQGDLSKCNTDKADAAKKNESLQGEIDNLNKQLAYLKENNTQAAGAPWEEYVTDPKTEPDTAKWLTRIYFPVL